MCCKLNACNLNRFNKEYLSFIHNLCGIKHSSYLERQIKLTFETFTHDVYSSVAALVMKNQDFTPKTLLGFIT